MSASPKYLSIMFFSERFHWLIALFSKINFFRKRVREKSIRIHRSHGKSIPSLPYENTLAFEFMAEQFDE